MTRTTDQVHCKFCNDLFTPNRPWQEFCSLKCRNNFHNDKKYDSLIKCPYCKTSTDFPGMIEKLRDRFYFCNVCTKTFEVKFRGQGKNVKSIR